VIAAQALSIFVLFQRQGMVNASQALEIATGKALASCLAENKHRPIDCSQTRLVSKEVPNTNILSTDEIWSFNFATDGFDIYIALDLAGESIKPQPVP
jgi:hypothetical protein